MGFLFLKCFLKFITKAIARYIITGDPTVIKVAYMKKRRMLDVATPNFSPNIVHTPKAYP